MNERVLTNLPFANVTEVFCASRTREWTDVAVPFGLRSAFDPSTAGARVFTPRFPATVRSFTVRCGSFLWLVRVRFGESEYAPICRPQVGQASGYESCVASELEHGGLFFSSECLNCSTVRGGDFQDLLFNPFDFGVVRSYCCLGLCKCLEVAHFKRAYSLIVIVPCIVYQSSSFSWFRCFASTL